MSSRPSLFRVGSQLMSLSSLGMFATLLTWLVLSIALHRQHEVALIDDDLRSWARTLVAAGQAPLIYLALLVPSTAYIWLLSRLRRLGKALYVHPPISPPVADAFRSTRRALVAALLLGMAGAELALIPLQVAGQAEALPPVMLDLTTLFFGVISVVCLGAVISIVDDALALADENRGFV